MGKGRRWLIAVLAFPLAAFFGFVGWYKAFAPLQELLEHHAWTAHVPVWIGRPMGVTEMLGAVALVAGIFPAAWRWTRLAALWLAASQIPSSIIHWNHGEADELPKNLLVFAMLLAVAALCRPARKGVRA
jgi:hypothetical protein